MNGQPLPDLPVSCELPLYEWEDDDLPQLRGLPNSKIGFQLDMKTGYSVAIYWTDSGQVTPHGAAWTVAQKAVALVDVIKYFVNILNNSDMQLFGVYFVAKQPEDKNLIYLGSSIFPRIIKPFALISEESFLKIWEEQIQGQNIGGRWISSDSSDSDFAPDSQFDL